MAAQSIPGERGRVKPRLKGWRAFFTHRTFRTVVQAVFVGFIFFVMARRALLGEGQGNVTPSAEAYCPFGGLESLYKFIVTGGGTVPHTTSRTWCCWWRCW